jgi:hypothetical protein
VACSSQDAAGTSGPRIQSVSGIANVASTRGPRNVAVVTCQHRRLPSGEPLVGPSGPSIVSA